MAITMMLIIAILMLMMVMVMAFVIVATMVINHYTCDTDDGNDIDDDNLLVTVW